MYLKYDKQDQQGKAVFNKRNPRTTKQQEPVARTPTKNGTGHKAENGQAYH
jgi:hypothetical protein